MSGRIVELVAAELAERDDRKSAWRLVGQALGKGRGERGVAGRIRKPGQQARRRRDIMLARQVAEREQQRHPAAPLAQAAHDIVIDRGHRHGRERGVGAVAEKARDVVGI